MNSIVVLFLVFSLGFFFGATFAFLGAVANINSGDMFLRRRYGTWIPSDPKSGCK